MSAAIGVVFIDSGAAWVALRRIVARGTNRHVQFGALGREQKIARPMLFVSVAGKTDYLSGFSLSTSLTGPVSKAHDGIGLAYVKIIALKCHSKRQMEVISEDETLADTVTVRTGPQKADAPGA